MPVKQFPSTVELKGERLTLRTFIRADLDAEAHWPDFDDLIYHHYNPPRDDGPGKDRRYLQSLRLFNLKLSIFDDDALVGYVGLYDTDFETGVSWMGIQFAANCRHRGYCKETLGILAGFFFGDAGMAAIRLEVAAFNLPGIRCYEAVGWVASRQFWHPHAYQRHLDFEHDPALAPIAHHFRRTSDGVEVDYIEMNLTDQRFRELNAD